MSFKKLCLAILVVLLAVFVYLKIEINGNPQSTFNQTTRFTLGKNPWFRAVLGLHNAGDARAEFLKGSGTINIEWFAPPSASIDQSLLQNFSSKVSQYTGRPTKVLWGGNINEGNTSLSGISLFVLRGELQQPLSGSTLLVYFTRDYSPRTTGELATTYQDSAIAISLDAHQQFLSRYPLQVNNYLLYSLLHEFGRQLGLPETNNDAQCAMEPITGTFNQTLDSFGLNLPQDFCPREIQQINSIKASL